MEMIRGLDVPPPEQKEESPAEEAKREPAEPHPLEGPAEKPPEREEPKAKVPKPPFIKRPAGRITLVILVVIMVVLASLVYYVYGRTGVTSVKVAIPEKMVAIPEKTYEGLKILVLTESAGASSYSGNAKLTIYYTEEGERRIVYTGEISMSDDKGWLVLPYNEFLYGPGYYQFRVEAGGKSAVVYYNCDQLVTGVKLGWDVNGTFTPFIEAIWNETSSSRVISFHGYFNISGLGALPGTTMDISVDKDGFTYDYKDINVSGRTDYQDELDYYDPGNYTITVRFHNPTRQDSPYRTVDVSVKAFLNVNPIVTAHSDKKRAKPKENIHFTALIDDEDADEIPDENITWYFGDTNNNGKIDDDELQHGREADKKYHKPGKYVVKLSVIDIYGARGYNETYVRISWSA